MVGFVFKSGVAVYTHGILCFQLLDPKWNKISLGASAASRVTFKISVIRVKISTPSFSVPPHDTSAAYLYGLLNDFTIL